VSNFLLKFLPNDGILWNYMELYGIMLFNYTTLLKYQISNKLGGCYAYQIK